MAKRHVSRPKTGTAKEISYDPDTGETKFIHEAETEKGKKRIEYTYDDEELEGDNDDE